MTGRRDDECKVLPYAAVAGDARAAAALDAIFYASSNTKIFADEAARAVFRERWLGRYLRHYPQYAFVAADGGGEVVGYIAGSLQDPVRDPLFADLDHFKEFAHLTPRYPAQLHVNLAEAWRGRGLGTVLIEAFAAMAAKSGAPGVHVVTSRGARNVRFYAANAFAEKGCARVRDDIEQVFLGRDLAN